MRTTLLSICSAFCLLSNFIQSAPLPQSQPITPEEKVEAEVSSIGKLNDLTVAIVPLDEDDESEGETIGDAAAGLRNNVGDEEELESEDPQEKKKAEDGEKEEQEAKEDIKEEPQTQEDEETKDEGRGEEDNEHKEEVREEEDRLDEVMPQLRQGEAAKNEEEEAIDDKSLKNAENKTPETQNEAGGEELIEILPNEEIENIPEEEREIKLVKRSKRSAQSSEGQVNQSTNTSELEEGLEEPIEVEDGNLEPDGDQLDSLPSDIEEDRGEHEEEIPAENSEE